jgi:ABC-type tungstate transport system permease subunit
MAAHNYVATFDNAKRGYDHVRATAAKAGVAVSTSEHGWAVLPATHRKSPNKREYAYIESGSGTKRAK